MNKKTEVYKLLTMYKNEIHGKRFSEQSKLTSDYADEIVKLFAIPDVSISYCDCVFPKPYASDNSICKKCKRKI